MDDLQFEEFIRSLARSRRSFLSGPLALAASWFGVSVAGAKKKHKHKKRKRKPKATPNEFGCLEVGDPCTSADECCSGVCEGTPGNKVCTAHDTGDCRPGERSESCSATSLDIRCTTSTGNPNGICDTTTGNAAYCVYDGDCFPCRKDVDCQAFCGPQAACIRCDSCPEGTSCVAPDEPGCNIE
jgi:hypothetical protein